MYILKIHNIRKNKYNYTFNTCTTCTHTHISIGTCTVHVLVLVLLHVLVHILVHNNILVQVQVHKIIKIVTSSRGSFKVKLFPPDVTVLINFCVLGTVLLHAVTEEAE